MMKTFWLLAIVLLTQQTNAQPVDEKAAALEAKRAAAAMRMSGNLPFLRGDAPPVKTPGVVASIAKSPLGAEQLQVYIKKTVAGVSKKVSAQALNDADAFAADYKAKSPTGAYLSDAALALWLVGANEAALVLMGRAAQQDPDNADNVNNFAAILVQHGGGQLALPILQNLNTRFPGNSTILNNIGQAWYSLGDSAQASKYLNSAMKIYPMHSMANYTQAIIEQAAGNTPAAVVHMKASMKEAYSDDKADRLEKMGVKLSSDDISWNIPRPRDEMGFGKFVAMRPAFYFSRGDVETLAPQWVAFMEATQSKINSLTQQAMALQASPKPQSGPTGPRPGIFAFKAAKKRYLLAKEEDERLGRFSKVMWTLNDKFDVIRASLTADLEAVAKQFPHPDKESPEVFRAYQAATCASDRKALDQLFELNKALNDQSTPFLADMKSLISDKIYFAKYSYESERNYQLDMLSSQAEFLGLLAGISNGMTGQVVSQPKCIDCGLMIENGMCELEPVKVVPHSWVLPDFDDLHCNIHGSYAIGGNGYFWDCNKESIKLKTDAVKIDYRENWAKQTYNMKFEVIASTSIGAVQLGPLSAEASVGGGVFVESSDKGLSDLGLVGKADVTAKVGIGPLSRDIGSVGAEVRNGINSGPTVNVSSLFGGYTGAM
jgi:tetratricopeptide (TPR) repeat protein